MSNQPYHATTWPAIAEFAAAGNLDRVDLNDDFTTINISIVYIGINEGITREMTIQLTCSDYCYFDIKRRDDHEPEAGIILDAYIHDLSPLISLLHAHKLESSTGPLMHEVDASTPIKHLEINGEVSVNILFTEIKVMATEMLIHRN